MAEDIEAPIKVTLDTSELDDVSEQFRRQGEGRLPSPAQTNLEERIRKKALKELEVDNKKQRDFQKEWRKGLTGVLIDLHWFRILASQSKVLGTNFQVMGKAMGFLLDMILLPMLPAMIEVAKFVFMFAKAIAALPKWLRSLIAVVGAVLVGFTVMETLLFFTANKAS